MKAYKWETHFYLATCFIFLIEAVPETLEIYYTLKWPITQENSTAFSRR